MILNLCRSYLVEQKNPDIEVPSIVYLYPQNGVISALLGVSISALSSTGALGVGHPFDYHQWPVNYSSPSVKLRHGYSLSCKVHIIVKEEIHFFLLSFIEER